MLSLMDLGNWNTLLPRDLHLRDRSQRLLSKVIAITVSNVMSCRSDYPSKIILSPTVTSKVKFLQS